MQGQIAQAVCAKIDAKADYTKANTKAVCAKADSKEKLQ